MAAIDPACGIGVFLQTRTCFFFPWTIFVTILQRVDGEWGRSRAEAPVERKARIAAGSSKRRKTRAPPCDIRSLQFVILSR